MKKITALLILTALLMSTALASKYMATADAMKEMMTMAKALGAKCTDCHLKDKKVSISNYTGADPAELKILATQKSALGMIAFMEEVNEKATKKMACVDCHNGALVPAEHEHAK